MLIIFNTASVTGSMSVYSDGQPPVLVTLCLLAATVFLAFVLRLSNLGLICANVRTLPVLTFNEYIQNLLFYYTGNKAYISSKLSFSLEVTLF
jgi:hypothetical protein